MSYTEYFRTKQAAQQKVVNVKNPTDASMYITKKRMESSRFFDVDGTSTGTLNKGTDRPVYNNAAVSFPKRTIGKHIDASVFTGYRGSQAIQDDAPYRNIDKKYLPCVDPTESPPTPLGWTYPTASDRTKEVKCPDNVSGVTDSPGDSKFVDNTISLSAMHTDMVTSGCCDNKGIVAPNHTHSPGIRVAVDNQRYAVGKGFFMKNPPLAEGPNVSPHKVGGYLGPRSGYVENKHGNVAPTRPVPEAPGGQGQEITQLKINKPTLGIIKPS
jgi:hypothetical protein